jgi:ribosomal-protein-alanine N-acetyltransferase
MPKKAASEQSGAVSLGPRNTERFVLRRFVESDAPSLAAMNMDSEVMRYIRPPDTDADEAMERARATIARQRGNYGLWAIEEKSGREFLGWGALKDLDGTEEIEVGYGLCRAAWGYGVATEVARELVRYGFEDLGLERIVGVTQPPNTVSRNVLLKLGMRYLGLVNRYYGRETTYFEMLRGEWSEMPHKPQGRGKDAVRKRVQTDPD